MRAFAKRNMQSRIPFFILFSGRKLFSFQYSFELRRMLLVASSFTQMQRNSDTKQNDW